MAMAKKTIKINPNKHFDKLVVLRNPGSTRARDEMGLVYALESHFEDDQVYELFTHTDSGKTNDWLSEASKQNLLAPRTLLAVIAGDGTLNHVVNTILNDGNLKPRQRKTVILPLWGGNANDLARTLNGMPSRQQVHKIMRQGAVVAVHPIEFTLQTGKKTPSQRLALCYASFGASASVARAINASSFRKVTLKTWPPLRFVRELALVIKTLSQAPPFRVVDGPQGKPRRLFERVFLNGPRLAKVERASVRLTDQHFYVASVSRMRLGALLQRALELSDRRFARKEATKKMTFTVLSDILGQFDGEDTDIKANTNVTAEVHAEPFYALSVRLK